MAVGAGGRVSYDRLGDGIRLHGLAADVVYRSRVYLTLMEAGGRASYDRLGNCVGLHWTAADVNCIPVPVTISSVYRYR
jgi:hypothetical protein